MKHINIGGADRLVRAIIGTVILAAGIHYESWWGLIGLLPLITGAFNFCPLYHILGFSTCRCDKPK